MINTGNTGQQRYFGSTTLKCGRLEIFIDVCLTLVKLKLTSEKQFVSRKWGSIFQTSVVFSRIINLSWLPHKQYIMSNSDSRSLLKSR